MNTEGSNLIVDVIAAGEGYQLSRTAEDCYLAFELLRRHTDENGVRHYSALRSAKMTSEGYEFLFDTGDTFTAATADAYPASDSVSDSSGGGSGGGTFPVKVEDYALDKTWSEITAALIENKVVQILIDYDESYGAQIAHVLETAHIKNTGYAVVCSDDNIGFVAEDPDDYPTFVNPSEEA